MKKDMEIESSSNPFCDACAEKPVCLVSKDGTCAMIRIYLEAKRRELK